MHEAIVSAGDRLIPETAPRSNSASADPAARSAGTELGEMIDAVLQRVRMDAASRSITIALGGLTTLTVVGNRAHLIGAIGGLLNHGIAHSAPGAPVEGGGMRQQDHAVAPATDPECSCPRA